MKANKAVNQSNLLTIFARLSESSCKRVNKAKLHKESIVNLSKAKQPKPAASISEEYRTYSPKIRQQVISNKLLNTQLYDLYTVRKMYCSGQWLRDNIADGTITIAKQTYIVSWLDILPIDAYKEDTIVLSLRSPKYKDSISKEYSLSYAVVTKGASK